MIIRYCCSIVLCGDNFVFLHIPSLVEDLFFLVFFLKLLCLLLLFLIPSGRTLSVHHIFATVI